MKVRAVAAPSQDSTAVGAVELDCTPLGLCMTYLGVGAYQRGYAPGAVTRGTRSIAPWQDVIDVRTHEDAVLVAVNPALTPHHKLYLKNFSEGDVDEHERAHKARLLRLGTGLFMVAVVVSIAASVPLWSPGTSQGTALVIGMTAAFLVLVGSMLTERFWLLPRADSETLQRRFLAEVQVYRPLPVLPVLVRAPSTPRLGELLYLLPRSATAMVIVLSAGSLAAILTSSWILDGGSARAPSAIRAEADRFATVEVERAGPASSPAAPADPSEPEEATNGPPAAAFSAAASLPAASSAAPSADAAPLGGQCSCERPDSVLWRLPLPRLSTLMIEQRSRSHEDHHHIELELAVVNNGQTDLEKVSLSVDFFEGEGKTPTKHRPLYYENALVPGQAIKWSVEARGTSFVVNNPNDDVLTADAIGDADAFAKLLEANHRPVRLHGAMMLAYHGDPRAAAGAAELASALREEEGPYLERVLAAARATVACDIRSRAHLEGSTVELCAFNRGKEAKDSLSLSVRGLDRVFDFRSPVAPPPVVVAERSFILPGVLAAGEGRWLSLEVPTRGQQVQSFEAFLAPAAP